MIRGYEKMEKTMIIDKFKACGHIFGIMVTLDIDGNIDKDEICYLVMLDTLDGKPYTLTYSYGYNTYLFSEQIKLLTDITTHAK